MGEVGPVTIHGANNTVFGWLTIPWLAGTATGEIGTRINEPATLLLARTVMGNVGARIISRSKKYCGWLARLWARSVPVTFHGASNTVDGWHGYGRGQRPVTFYAASNTVGGWQGYGRARRP